MTRFDSAESEDTMATPASPKRWPVQDAKARFSEFLEASLTEGAQVVTRRGVETAVLVPLVEWRRLQRAARLSLKELLLAGEPTADIPLPDRKRWHRRASPVLE